MLTPLCIMEARLGPLLNSSVPYCFYIRGASGSALWTPWCREAPTSSTDQCGIFQNGHSHKTTVETSISQDPQTGKTTAIRPTREAGVSRQSCVPSWGHPLKSSVHHNTIVFRSLSRVLNWAPHYAERRQSIYIFPVGQARSSKTKFYNWQGASRLNLWVLVASFITKLTSF